MSRRTMCPKEVVESVVDVREVTRSVYEKVWVIGDGTSSDDGLRGGAVEEVYAGEGS